MGRSGSPPSPWPDGCGDGRSGRLLSQLHEGPRRESIGITQLDRRQFETVRLCPDCVKSTAHSVVPCAPRLPRLCRSGERCTMSRYPFLRQPPPRWVFSSPGPCRHQGSFSQKSGCYGRVRSPGTTCDTLATSPRTLPRYAGAHPNQAAGHAVIWRSTLRVRRDAQGARDGALSVPHGRRSVCAINHTVENDMAEAASP